MPSYVHTANVSKPQSAARRWIYGLAALLLVGGLVTLILTNRRDGGPAGEWFSRGTDAVARRDLAAAEVNFQHAISLNPTYGEAYQWLAEVEIVSQHPQAAVQVVQELGRRLPDAPHLSTLFAEAYSLGDNVQLLRWARAAVMEEPRSPRAHVLMALALARSGDRQDALARLAAANYLEPSPLLRAVMTAGAQASGNPAALPHLIAPLVPQTSL